MSIADPNKKATALNKIRDEEATSRQKSLPSQVVQDKLKAMKKVPSFEIATFSLRERFVVGVSE